MSDLALDLHSAAFTRVKADSAIDDYFENFRKSPMLKLQPKKLPNLSVYLLRDVMVPDGDANAGEPRFLHNTHIGFSGAILADDEDAALLKLDAIMARIPEVLFKDPTFVAMIEGVVSCDRRFVFSNIGETPMAEIQLEMVFSYRSDWEPNVPNDFEGIVLQATPWPSSAHTVPIIRKLLVDSGG